jgi:hypothetical protein
MAKKSEDTERFFVFVDFLPTAVFGQKNLNAELAKKSEPVLRQEVLWGTRYFEEYFAIVHAENQTEKATEHVKQLRNAALVAEMELDRRSTKRAECFALKIAVITFIFAIITLIIGAFLGAHLTGSGAEPPN